LLTQSELVLKFVRDFSNNKIKSNESCQTQDNLQRFEDVSIDLRKDDRKGSSEISFMKIRNLRSQSLENINSDVQSASTSHRIKPLFQG